MSDPLPHERFETERPRLQRIATRILADPVEAQDVVQQAWIRMRTSTTPIDEPAAWLTTVTTRLCVDRLRSRTPVPTDVIRDVAGGPDPAEVAQLADSVGTALHVVLDRLAPAERVAFVLHDTFGVEFAAIAAALDTTPAAARKLASRARAKVRAPLDEARRADAQVIDAFMAAARGGDIERLLALLAPDATVTADAEAMAVGTPARIDARSDIAAFFNGSAHSALAVMINKRPGFAWFDRGRPRVVFDFDVADGQIRRLVFRAEESVLDSVIRRDDLRREG